MQVGHETIRQTLLQFTNGVSPPPTEELLDKLWSVGVAWTSRLTTQRRAAETRQFDCVNWDGFHTAPTAWAHEASSAWRGPMGEPTQAADYMGDAPHALLLERPHARPAALQLLKEMLRWKEWAKKQRPAVWRHGCSGEQSDSGGGSTATRSEYLVPATTAYTSARRVYAPRVVTLPDGHVASPSTAEQVRQGAAQEWQPLHQGPSIAWDHRVLHRTA